MHNAFKLLLIGWNRKVGVVCVTYFALEYMRLNVISCLQSIIISLVSILYLHKFFCCLKVGCNVSIFLMFCISWHFFCVKVQSRNDRWCASNIWSCFPVYTGGRNEVCNFYARLCGYLFLIIMYLSRTSEGLMLNLVLATAVSSQFSLRQTIVYIRIYEMVRNENTC